MIDFFVKRQFINYFKIEDFYLIVIMLEQTFFQLVDNLKKFLILDKEFFIIFCDDYNDIVDHNNAKISIV